MNHGYQNYSASGFEAVGDIPSHWNVLPLKRLLLCNDGGVWGDDPDGSPGETIVLRSTDQTVDGRWSIDEPAMRKIPLKDAERFRLQVGDLLLTKSSGSSLHIGKTTLVDEAVADLKCCYSNFMQRLRSNEETLPRFVWYFLNNRIARDQMGLLSNSTTGLANLNASIIGGVVTPRPPLPEQRAIAVFLDRETGKIDALVEQQRRLIALLKEKRQAVISHAVTKGLDPTAPMKDSGLNWLGEIPAHWSIGRLKHDLAFLTSGSRGWAEYYADQGALFLRIGNLTRDTLGLNLDDIQRVDVPDGSEGERTRVRAGDLLFSITAYLGSVAVVPEWLEEAFVSQHVALARLNGERLMPEWVGYVSLSVVGQTYLDEQGYGGTKVQLALDDVANMVMPMPPLDEQATIVQFVEQETSKLRQLITEAEKAIALLQERRSALISAAVTGKIDVRGEVPEETEAA